MQDIFISKHIMQNCYRFHYDFSGIQKLHRNFEFSLQVSFRSLEAGLFASRAKFALRNFQE